MNLRQLEVFHAIMRTGSVTDVHRFHQLRTRCAGRSAIDCGTAAAAAALCEELGS
jgi:hypothetical protein